MSFENKVYMFGCFVSGPSLLWDATELEEKEAEEKGIEFRQYIWGENGIDNLLKEVINNEYGTDVVLILFQFYLNPIQYELENLNKTEGYRKKEKSIAKNIIITDENFFLKANGERLVFLKSSILNSLIQLNDEYSSRLDIRFDLLIRELKKLFDYA